MNKKILALAIPNIISNLSVPLLGLADTALMGHLTSEVYLGAVALGGMIFNFLFWGLGFLRMGTTGITAQAYGNRNLKKCVDTLLRAFLVALLATLCLVILQKPIVMLNFYWIEGSQSVERLAKEYFYIRIYAAPATIGLYVMTGWFLGMQNAKAPMWIAIFVNLSNLGFNYLFVIYWGMASAGVALGTVIAQYMGLILGVGILWIYYRKIFRRVSLKKLIEHKELKHFFEVNQDIFIRTLALIFTFSFFYAESAKYGDLILAINSILMQFIMILSYGVDGFAFAAESLVGKYAGTRDTQNLRVLIKLLFLWGMGIASVFFLICLFEGELLTSLLTTNLKVLERIKEYSFWMLMAPFANSICFIWDGVYIGATASKTMRNTMLQATFLIFFPVYFLTKQGLGNHALWLAFTCFMLCRGVLLTLWARKYIYKPLSVI